MRYQDASEYTKGLANELQSIGAVLPQNFNRMFLGHARRLSQGSHSDLGTLLIIECLEAKKQGIALTAIEIQRAIDRVRHRLSREATAIRERFAPLPNDLAASAPTPSSQAAAIEFARLLLSGLNARE